MDISKIKLIAYYLPQYYEIEFNNKYWGKGYTEWTVTAKAKPLFKGHYQPHIPADLGFYNLLMPEAREAQAKMAKEYGIDGFCYWHYWFGNGEVEMEKPFRAVVESGKPDFPFCLCWANHSWHNPATGDCIREQKYPGAIDCSNHFYYLLNAFRDERYIKIDGKPLFGIFEPTWMPNLDEFIMQWQNLAKENGLEGIFFYGMTQNASEINDLFKTKLDAVNANRLKDFIPHENQIKEYLKYKFSSLHNYPYSRVSRYFINKQDSDERMIPTIIPGWDHSPRSGKTGLILTGYTPDTFETHIRSVMDLLSTKQNKLCFIKAWNEWGEGNHLEPDLKWGRAFLDVLLKVKNEYQK